MTSVFGEGSVLLIGVTGVTTLIETGVLMGGGGAVSLATADLPEVRLIKVTMTVPVWVPFGRVDGSAVTVRVMPWGVRIPLGGVTESHGSSVEAVKFQVCPGMPGMKNVCTIGLIEPTGVVMSGLSSFRAGKGMMTTRATSEKSPTVPKGSPGGGGVPTT